MSLANHLWQSTLFAAAAALLTLALRRNAARIRHAVWLAASCKFLVPLSLLLALGGHIHWREAPSSAPANLAAAADAIAQPFTLPAVSFDAAPPPPSHTRLPAILFALWACGFLAIAASWWLRWRRIRSAVGAASALPLRLPIPARSSATAVEPGVFGILRPVLLLPEGIFERLTPAQLDAVIAHELCHVRYRDNAVAAVHMLVETVFWFHPLVWWIGKRMVEERERACDEEVLRLGNPSRVYAEAILNVCRLYVESPLACVSGVTGADLQKRIHDILRHRGAERLSLAKKAVLAACALAALAAPIALGLLHAQSAPAAGQKFEVASVKPVKDCGAPIPVMGKDQKQKGVKKGNIRSVSPGRLHVCSDVRELARNAWLTYGEDRAHPLRAVEGGPGWVDSDLFDINAKAENAADQATMMGPMLRALLVDRFQLQIRRETREIPVYLLTVGKDGPRLKATLAGSCVPPEAGKPIPPPEPGQKRSCGMSEITGQSTYAEWTLTGAEIRQFAGTLGGLVLDRPVVDQTGLTGVYDMHLEFGYDSTGLKIPHPPMPEDAPSGAPSIFAAVQKLGLKLEPGKGPAAYLVIDHAVKPTSN